METLRQRESSFSLSSLHPTARGTIINLLNKGEERSKGIAGGKQPFPPLSISQVDWNVFQDLSEGVKPQHICQELVPREPTLWMVFLRERQKTELRFPEQKHPVPK